MSDYEVSATYFDSLLRGLKRGTLPQLLEVMDPATQAVVLNVWSDSWQPAVHLEAFGEAVVKVLGPEAFAELAYGAMKDRFEGIIMPMLKRSLETSQRSPSAILSRMTGLVELGMRGLEILWKENRPNGGILQIKYPRPVAAPVEHSWRGVLRFVFEMTQATGKVAEFMHLPDGATLQFRLEW
jgi:hypothetical protein